MPSSYSGKPVNVTSQNALSITGATNAAPIAITTTTPHLWSTGDQVIVYGVGGNTAANSPLTDGQTPAHLIANPAPWTIIVTGASTFTLTGSTGNGAYTSGGLAVNVSLQPAFNEPLDGEAPTVASILTAVEALADRSQYQQIQAARIGPTATSSYLSAINWNAAVQLDSGTVLFDTFHLRRDGSTAAFWSSSYGLWVLCNSNVAGSFYFGDLGLFNKRATGVGTPPKLDFGVDNGNGLLLFSGTAVGGATTIPYVRENPLGTFAKLTIAAAVSNMQTNDAVVIPTGAHAGRIVVVGSFDSDHSAWTSDDNGATFTHRAVSATGVENPLDRVIVGKNGILFAWPKQLAAGGGNTLEYSSDGGATWSRTGALGFDSIIAGVYVATEDMYAFLQAGALRLTRDPTVGPFVTIALGGINNTAIACVGSLISIAQSESGGASILSQKSVIGTFRLEYQALAWGRVSAVNMLLQYTYSGISVSPDGQMLAVGYQAASAGMMQQTGKA
jgi:hypothetical protein